MSIGVDLFYILGLLSFTFNGVTSNDENSAEAYPSYEYMQIFQGVPSFFEYLLNAVEENPEILENNDAKVTEHTIKEDIYNNDSPYIANDDEKCVESENNEGSHGIDLEKDSEVFDKRKGTSTVAYEYGNSFVTIGPKDNTCEKKKKREVNSDKNMAVAKDTKVSEIKSNAYSHDEEAPQRDSNDDDDDDDWEKGFIYPGFQSLLSLDITAEEIEEGIIRTEKLLEDYNYNRLNKRKS